MCSTLGVSPEELAEKAEWLCRDHPQFKSATVMFFRTAGSLLKFSQYDLTLLPLALFQAVIGLERVLKVHFQSEKARFKRQLQQAVADGVICDRTFTRIEPLKGWLADRIEKGPSTYAEKFASLIPSLRNEFFHGSFSLDPQFLLLTVQVREAVDALLESPRPAPAS